MERWLPIPDYEGLYEISDAGRIRSLERLDRIEHRVRERFLKFGVTSKGYLTVSLCRDGAVGSFRVHRLALSAFIGPAPEGTVTRHLDGNPANNTLPNLTWGTHSENNRDRISHGTHQEAAKTHCPSGHPYEGTNLYVNPNTGSRQCVQCRRNRYAKDGRDRARRYYAANPEKARERMRNFRTKKKEGI